MLKEYRKIRKKFNELFASVFITENVGQMLMLEWAFLGRELEENQR